MRGWGLPWLLLGLAGNVIGPPADPPVRIQADALLNRTLGSGEVHRYLLTLDSGDYARLEILQQGLDVAAILRGPSGSELVKVDTPTGLFSTEQISVVAEKKGNYEVQVRSAYGGDTGRYRLSLAALHKAGSDDRLRVEAERADLTASQRAGKGGQEAIENAGTAIERWRALGDRFHENRALARLGTIQARSGDPAEALATYEKTLSVQRELDDREGMADTLYEMGRALRTLGQNQPAAKALEESTALWQEVRRPDKAVWALVVLGSSYESSGDNEAAFAAYERALELSRQAGDRPGEALALNHVGKIRISLGQPALDDLRNALDLARSTGREQTEAKVLTNLGALYRNLGMPHEALEHFDAAREIFRKLEDAEQQGTTLINLGSLLFQLGALEEAQDLLLKALALHRTPDAQAMDLVALSRIDERLGNTRQAGERLDKALELQRTGGKRAGVAETLLARGLLLLKEGEPARAEQMLRQSLDIFEEVGSRSGSASARLCLARAQAAQGKLPLARQSFEEARKQWDALGDPGGQAVALADLGRLEQEAGNLTAARDRLRSALELQESFRSEVAGETLRALYFASIRETHERYVDVLMQLHRAQPKAELDAEAFAVAEQSRARSLLDVLARARVDLNDGDPDLKKRELHLRQELNAKAALRMSLPEDEASRPRREALLEQINSLTTEHRIADARLRDSSRSMDLRQPSIQVPEIQELLDEETVLLEYLLAEPRSYLWVVTSRTLDSFELPGRQEIEDLARRLHAHLSNPGEREASAQRQGLKLLSAKLLEPVLPVIAGRRLVIVADGALQYVPFAALPVPSKVAGGTGSVPLVLEHESVLLPSAAVLREIRRARAARPQRPSSLAVVADPIYDGSESRPRRVLEAASRGAELQRLTWAHQEANGIAAVAKGRDVYVALRAKATRELVTSGQLDRFRILHFATHGILDDDHPYLSGLALSQVDEAGNRLDGFLRLQDLYSLHLQADLVVLSGCETGLGRDLRGEGLVSLTNGFLHAGASQVVASLWPVRDRAAAELMQSFYRSMLNDGLRPAAALRAAQIEMLQARRDPYYWAAFVPQGDWMAGAF